jgi:ribosome-associated protein
MIDAVDEYIELNTFLKLNNIAPTGGQAKIIIRSEAVTVNGIIETRNKKKLRDGDIVGYSGKKYPVQISVYKKIKM